MKKIKKNIKNKTWFKLDNAGTVFPGQNTPTWSNVIRVSINLKEEVDPEILFKAVKKCLPRFPTMAVRLRNGFFWHYIEKNPEDPVVLPDANNPCLRIKFNENNRYMFKVFYYKNRISLEIFHALTDGYGACVFLNTFTAEYLRMKGYDIPVGGMVLDINEKPKEEEIEDSYVKYASKTGKEKIPLFKTYHRIGEKMPKHTSNITTGYIPVDKIKALSKENGVTITEYLSAVLMYLHMQFQKNENIKQKDVCMQIPVNGRNQFNSQTLRNFSVNYNLRIDPNWGDYTFEEVLRHLSLSLRLTNTPQHLSVMYAGNLAMEKNPVMRFIPIIIKDLAVGITFAIAAEKTTTAIFTNVGIVRIPDEMMEHVKSFILMPSPGQLNGARVGAASIGNTMAITFANMYKDTDVEREFFRFLVKKGIPVKIESNKQ
ncbi:MAG: alcohol acetyltransferase [Clostridia bacterium]|nr:alcohol acetyltransferase [Clostridia bacterium]